MTTYTTTSPTSGGALPEAVTEIGGIVLDLVGLNGVRVVAQLAASQLYEGYFDNGTPVGYRGNPGTIGIQTGLSAAAVDAGPGAAAPRRGAGPTRHRPAAAPLRRATGSSFAP